jgi:hypothetical protein
VTVLSSWYVRHVAGCILNKSDDTEDLEDGLIKNINGRNNICLYMTMSPLVRKENWVRCVLANSHSGFYAVLSLHGSDDSYC